MKIINGLHIDYVIVELDGSEPDHRTKSGRADAARKVVHIDEIPQQIIDDFIRDNSH